MSDEHDPQVATSVVNNVRRQLIVEGRWPELEKAALDHAPSLEAWLAAADTEEWIDFEGYAQLMSAFDGVLGSEGMKELGRGRLGSDLEIGSLAPMLRSWFRELGEDPEAVLRVAPHVWHGITRHAGQMVVVESDSSSILFLFEGAPASLERTTGWHRLFEGFGEALLERGGLQGSVRASLDPESGELVVRGTWSSGG